MSGIVAVAVAVAVAATLAVLVGACGNDPPVTSDGGATSDSGAPVRPGDVAPPTPPNLLPCPGGWREIDIDGVVGCAPPLADVALDFEECPVGMGRFIDSPNCTTVGPVCPIGDFPDPASLPAADRISYVRAGALAGGDGSERRPYATIGAAMRVALPGTLIVVGKGDYPETVDVFANVSVLGACTAETRITPTTGMTAVRMNEPGASLAHVTVAPTGPLLGVSIRATAITLDALIIDGATGVGLDLSSGASANATSLVISHTVINTAVDLCRAIALSDAELTLMHASLSDNEGDGISALGASHVTASELAIVDTGLTHDVPRALGAQDGAIVEVGRSYIARYRGAIATALGAGARVVLSDVVVADATGVMDADAAGMIASENAELSLTRTRFDRIGTYALYVLGGASGTITDVVVRGVGAARDFGIAFGAGPGATFTARRVAVFGAENAALFASGTGGPGVPDGAGPTLDVEDFTVTGANIDGTTAGYGLALANGTHGTLRRVAIRDVRGDGILVQEDGTDVTFADLDVSATAQQGDGRYGRALEAQYGAHVTIERGRLAGNTEATVMTYGTGASLTMHLVAIEDTRARACAETTCRDAPAGVGVGAYASATARLDDFVIDGAPLCGVQLADGGALDLANGVIRNANVGACVQDAGYDLERVTGSVRYEENDINVDSATREIPAPAHLDLSL